MEIDEYLTIKVPSQGVFKDRKSRFIGLTFPILTENSFKQTIKQIKKDYNDASHHCYAYVLGLNRNTFHSSDDGEPANTAGVQILAQINSKQLTNILVVVVRYFGGIKLGVPGLINSYRQATSEALNNAKIIKEFEKSNFKINFKYQQISYIMNLLKEYKCQINSKIFELECNIDFKIRKSFEPDLLKKINSIKNITIQTIN